MKRFIRVFLVIILIGAVGFGAWLYLKKSGTSDAFGLIPEDAVFVIESTDMIKGWETLAASKMWNHLITNNTFYEEVNADILWLDSLIKGNRSLMGLFEGRQVLISTHLIADNDYDFLFAVDLGKASKISFLQNYLIELAQLADFSTSKEEIEGVRVHVLTDRKSKEPLYLAFVDNLLSCSFHRGIIEASIKQVKSGKSITDAPGFSAANNSISHSRLFNFYFNFAKIYDFARIYTTDLGESVKSLTNALFFAAFNVNLADELLRFEGYVSLNDSSLSYLNALATVNPGKQRSFDLISDKAAFVISLGFSNYMDFYNGLMKEFARQDTGGYEDIAKAQKRIERLLKVNLEQDFYSWIGSEVALVKLRPTALLKEDDAIAFVHASDIALAREGLNRISGQIAKRSPVRIRSSNYQGYDIHYIELKGFFRLFFGKLFAGIEKPYYFFLEDYVVFSNSKGALVHIIDDYLREKTMSRSPAFTSFRDNFAGKSNVSLFVQMPRLYSHLLYYGQANKKEAIKTNKNLILSFSMLGYQMIKEGSGFRTSLMAWHDENAAFDDELEHFEAAIDDLYNLEYENLSFTVPLTEDAKSGNSVVKIFYPDTTALWGEGLVKSGYHEGAWRIYFPSGNLMALVNYHKGSPNGPAAFFFDDVAQSRKAEFEIRNGKIDGSYLEFFETGVRKARLTYDKGVLNGKAEFYYETGILRVDGEYRKGKKSGKWLHYTDEGNLFDKESWRRNKRRG